MDRDVNGQRFLFIASRYHHEYPPLPSPTGQTKKKARADRNPDTSLPPLPALLRGRRGKRRPPQHHPRPSTCVIHHETEPKCLASCYQLVDAVDHAAGVRNIFNRQMPAVTMAIADWTLEIDSWLGLYRFRVSIRVFSFH